YYIEQASSDGLIYWDTGAPGLAHMGDYRDRPSEPDNAFEPVDSSAASIVAQGMLRLGRSLQTRGEEAAGARYHQAALTIAKHLFAAPYLSESPAHEGLILHSIYSRSRQPRGEEAAGARYHQAALTIAKHLFAAPYLSESPAHEGLILHSIYHRPNGS